MRILLIITLTLIAFTNLACEKKIHEANKPSHQNLRDA